MNGDMAYIPGTGSRFLEITYLFTKVSSSFFLENSVRLGLLCYKNPGHYEENEEMMEEKRDSNGDCTRLVLGVRSAKNSAAGEKSPN